MVATNGFGMCSCQLPPPPRRPNKAEACQEAKTKTVEAATTGRRLSSSSSTLTHWQIVLISVLLLCDWAWATALLRPPLPPQQIHILNHLYHSDNINDMSKESRLLKVFSVNMWGLRWPFGEDDIERFQLLRDVLKKEDYDFVLLQEVWYRNQYDMIKGLMPYMSEFVEFNPRCTGKFIVPFGCSGLVILSKYPIEFAGIRPFSVRGSFWNFDGEVFVRKGIARARSRWNGFTVDLFTSHLVSYTNNPNYDNTMYRFQQVMEVARAIRDSDADIKLFGGDLNALPYLSDRQPYRILRTVSADSLTNVFDEDASFHPFFSTYGNPENSYKGTAIPERIDYLMYASAPTVKMTCVKFALPFHMGRDKEGAPMSLSDHEGLYGEYLVEWRGPPSQSSQYAVAKSADDDPPKATLQPATIKEQTLSTALTSDFNSRTSFYDDSGGGSQASSTFLDFFQTHHTRPDPYHTYSYEKPVSETELRNNNRRRRPYNQVFVTNNRLHQEEKTVVTDNQFVISRDSSDLAHNSDLQNVMLHYRTDRKNSVRRR